jgi:hypothetical protein
VRVRPLNAKEEAAGSTRVVRCVNPKALELIAGEDTRQYPFDLCAHEGFSQVQALPYTVA